MATSAPRARAWDAAGAPRVARGGVQPPSDALLGARAAAVGLGAVVGTALGERLSVYCDWAATGRAHAGVERCVLEGVLPTLANTHTTTSAAGLQTTCFREEARGAVARATNCRVQRSDKHSDVVVFAGHGATGAVNKLVGVLGLDRPLRVGASDSERAVVFVGPHEHHSNLLPWRESSALVVAVPEGVDGRVDEAALKAMLEEHKRHPLLIGAFSAASNVTGIEADVDGITETLHRAGALALWDYAQAAPFASLDMNPVRMLADGSGVNPWVYKDAAFVATHKMLGGPGAPGILLAKRALFSLASAPAAPGGGTVFFVTPRDHRYLSSREEREEGGTPDVVGAARAGLAFAVRARLLAAGGEARDRALGARVDAALRRVPSVEVLGPAAASVARLASVSFMVRAPVAMAGGRAQGAAGTAAGLYLHYNFVCALLNDVFGVQCRGGCACAGPYGLALLGISDADAAAIEAQLLDKHEVLRPGFARLSFAPFMSDDEVEYVLAAVRAVAAHGWRALPQYRFDTRTGECKHASRARSFPERRWLAHMDWERGAGSGEAGGSEYTAVPHVRGDGKIAARMAAQLAAGEEWLAALAPGGGEWSGDAAGLNASLEGEAEALRWFMLPAEAHAAMGGAPPSGGEADNGADGTQRAVPVRVRVYDHDSNDAVAATDAASSFTPDIPRGAAADVAKAPAVAAAVTATPLEPAGTAADPVTATPATATEAAPAPGRAPSRKHALHTGSEPLAPPAYVALGERLRREAAATAANQQEQEQLRREHTEELEHAEAQKGVSANGGSNGAAAATAPLSRKALRRAKAQGAFAPPPPKLMKLLARANAHWDMIVPGDRVLLGLSGGKDSLALLHCLAAYQRRFPPGSWSLAVATVDPGTDAFNPRPLIKYVESLGLTYHYLESPIMSWATEHMQGDSICAFCSRMKRGALYSCCRTHGYNKLALAQHLDDQAESFLMSTLHNGKLRVMKARYRIDAGDIEVIRPFVYAREKSMRDYAYSTGMPVIADNCPACFEAPKERHSVKKLLQREEAVFPSLYSCVLRAIVPLMDPVAQDMLVSVSDDLEVRASTKAARSKAADQVHVARLKARGVEVPKAATAALEATANGNGAAAGTLDGEGATLAAFSDRELMAELRRRQAARRGGADGDQIEISGGGGAEAEADAFEAFQARAAEEGVVGVCRTAAA